MLLIGMSIGEAKIIECIKDKNAWCLAVLRNIFAPVLISVLCLILHAVQKRRGDGKPCMRYFYNFDFNNFSAKFRSCSFYSQVFLNLTLSDLSIY